MRRANLEATAQEKMDDIELCLIELDVERQSKGLEYQENFLRRKYSAWMPALAWGEYEDAKALSEDETIQRTRSRLSGYQHKRSS